MKSALTRESIMSKTMQVGISTLGSRFLGIIREVLTVRYLGASSAADAFITAWKIPNSLRKIFAEGALSAAFIPMLVKLVKGGHRDDANGLMSLGFIVFEGIVLLLCVLVILKAESVVWLMAPGFSEEQVLVAMPYLQILMPFIFFVSSSALLAGALQSVNHFFVPAISPILMNIVFILALVICITYALPIEWLCYFILFGGLLQFLWHLGVFFRLHFSFGSITKRVRRIFLDVFAKFGNCLLSMSVMELSLVIDTQFASWLPSGSVALIYYANRLMGIPLGVFVTAFSTILLPHFSHVVIYAPKRLSFYLLEATKLIFWVTIPVTFLMIFFSKEIFITVFLSDKFPMEKVLQASNVLIAFMIGLPFFSMNRILLNLYYALHNTFVPAIVSIIATLVNISLNWLFIDTLQAPGLALATVVSALVQTILYLWYLYRYQNFTFYFKHFAQFSLNYMIQLLVVGFLFVCSYYAIYNLINYYFSSWLAQWLLNSVLLWFWIGPLLLASFMALYYFRASFNVKLYFFD